MSYNGFILHNFLNLPKNKKDRKKLINTYNWWNVAKTWGVLQVNWLDSSNPLSVVHNFKSFVMGHARLDQRIKNNVAIVVDDGDSGQLLTFVSKNSFAVKR